MKEENIQIQQLISTKYEKLSLEEKKLVHFLYHKNSDELSYTQEQLKKIIFRLRPPTPAEFLDPRNEWLTKSFTDNLYPHVIDDFLEITSYNKNYTEVCEYGATRIGKTYLIRLIVMYTIVYIHHLRHPQLYYDLSPTTQLSIYFMCFNVEKIKQLLLKPVYNFFNSSPRFKQIKFQDKVKEEQYKNGLDIIYWSRAATFGEITLDSDLTINLGTDFMSFIGSDMLMLIISEIAFFIEKTSATNEQIFQIYTDGLDRINATVGDNYLGMVYLDTSANDIDNPIEKYILEDLALRKDVFFRKRNRWEARPKNFPEWKETKKTFKMFVGNNIYPPKIIETQFDLDELPEKYIIDVPIDVKKRFEDAPLKSIKDIAGLPTIKETKFINNFNLILDIFSESTLKNIEGILYTESFEEPKNLIWDKIKDVFFTKTLDNKYKIYRAPKEIRFVGIDLAHSLTGDVQGITVGHKEFSKKLNTIIYVADFSFAIGSKESAINLEAVSCFIEDLVIEGQISIKQVFCDSFQSAFLLQFLNRNHIESIRQSVDKTINPYQSLLKCLFNKTIKSGKNIFLKNNLDSLLSTKTKKGNEIIDHTNGKTNNIYDGKWKESTCGENAKDVSDSFCQFVWGSQNYDYIPDTIFEEENERLLYKPQNKIKEINQAFDDIHICC